MIELIEEQSRNGDIEVQFCIYILNKNNNIFLCVNIKKTGESVTGLLVYTYDTTINLLAKIGYRDTK